MFENSSDFEGMSFKKALRKFLFTLENEDGGLEVYALMEMNSQQRDQFLDLMNKKMPGGRIREVEGLQAELLIRTIKKVCDEEGRHLVIASDNELADIKANIDSHKLLNLDKKSAQDWPCNMQLLIYEKSMKLNGLWNEEQQQKAVDAAKNS
jgi:hypothetical protein